MITDYELNIDYLSVQVDRIRAHAVLDGHDEAGRHEGGEVQRYRPQDLPGSGTECLCLFFFIPPRVQKAFVSRSLRSVISFCNFSPEIKTSCIYSTSLLLSY